jgi:hypothetical protein
MSHRALGRFAMTAALLSPLFARPARCGEPSPDAALSVARDLFFAAEKDEDAGRWSEALDKLHRVAQVKLTPGIRYHTALCEEHLGRLVEALNDYKAAAEQARVENASDVLRLVDRHVSDSAERVPRITIVVVPTLSDATVRLDGRPVAAGEVVLADPGTHSIDVDAPGRRTSAKAVTVQERDATRVEITLDPDVPSPGPTSAQSGVEMHEAAPLPRDPPSDSRGRAVTLIAGASALVLGAGGLAAYLVAGREHDESVQSCAQVVSRQTGACDAQKNAVRVWDWIGVAAWAGAAAAGVVAVVSFERLRHDAGRARADVAPTPSLSVRMVAGPTSMGVEGSF